MTIFILKRIGIMLLTMIAVSLLLFLLLEISPGNVATKVLGPYSSEEQRNLWLEQHGYRAFVSARPGEPSERAGRAGARGWIHETLVPPESEGAVRERITLWEMGHAEASARLSRTLGRIAATSGGTALEK